MLNYPKNLTYKERLIELNLLPLEYRREISDLIFFFKSKVGLVTTDLRKFLCTFKPRYRTRNYDPNNYYLTLICTQSGLLKTHILTLLGLPNYGTHYHRKLSRLLHLISLKTAFSIFMFLRDQVIPPRVKIQVISFGVL